MHNKVLEGRDRYAAKGLVLYLQSLHPGAGTFTLDPNICKFQVEAGPHHLMLGHTKVTLSRASPHLSIHLISLALQQTLQSHDSQQSFQCQLLSFADFEIRAVPRIRSVSSQDDSVIAALLRGVKGCGAICRGDVRVGLSICVSKERRFGYGVWLSFAGVGSSSLYFHQFKGNS